MKISSLKLFKKIATMCQSQKAIRKRIVYQKESVYFQEFWPQVVNLWRTFIHLLPTACEYSMFLHLPKLKMTTLKLPVIQNMY